MALIRASNELLVDGQDVYAAALEPGDTDDLDKAGPSVIVWLKSDRKGEPFYVHGENAIKFWAFLLDQCAVDTTMINLQNALDLIEGTKNTEV